MNDTLYIFITAFAIGALLRAIAEMMRDIYED